MENVAPCNHQDKGRIDWDIRPEIGVGDGTLIAWYGTCECGKRVFEQYIQGEEVFEADE